MRRQAPAPTPPTPGKEGIIVAVEFPYYELQKPALRGSHFRNWFKAARHLQSRIHRAADKARNVLVSLSGLIRRIRCWKSAEYLIRMSAPGPPTIPKLSRDQSLGSIEHERPASFKGKSLQVKFGLRKGNCHGGAIASICHPDILHLPMVEAPSKVFVFAATEVHRPYREQVLQPVRSSLHSRVRRAG